MNTGTYPLAASMINQLNRVDVLSNNLANSNTVGFKQDNLVEGSFNQYLQDSLANKTDMTKHNILRNTVPKIDGQYMNEDVGNHTITGNKLDFSIVEREAFFKIRNNNNEVVFTRDGSFKNLDGFLVNHQGERVLNENNDPIAVVDGFEQQIALVKTPFSNLEKIGNNNYRANDPKQVENLVISDNIEQGSVERSNVNTIATMVALIDSQRRLDQAQKAITGISDLSEKLISKIGSR